eukprot:2343187-Alexandrium_andersonii.AAC.1
MKNRGGTHKPSSRLLHVWQGVGFAGIHGVTQDVAYESKVTSKGPHRSQPGGSTHDVTWCLAT